MKEDLEGFLTKVEEDGIVEAIKEAEMNTSGEIRVHLEEHSQVDSFDRAKKVFASLEMHKTDLRNGVLFYVGVQDHSFVILGDQGIDKVVADDFWESTKDLVIASFSKGDFAEGLVSGIREAGIQLKNYFPYEPDDENELSDEISKS
jgi:uncharacterized membrane protein